MLVWLVLCKRLVAEMLVRDCLCRRNSQLWHHDLALVRALGRLALFLDVLMCLPPMRPQVDGSTSLMGIPPLAPSTMLYLSFRFHYLLSEVELQ